MNIKRLNDKATNSDSRTPYTNKNLRSPLSSSSAYVTKMLSTLGFKRKNEVFSMIKMGDLQKNQLNQQFSNTATFYPNKFYEK